MAEKPVEQTKQHALSLHCRTAAEICGVGEVESFDSESVVLQTDCGELTVEGEGLRMGALNTETGRVEITGRINALYYSDKPQPRRGLRQRFFS